MNLYNSIKILVTVSILSVSLSGASWTAGPSSSGRTFTKPINFWNAVVTTSTTQQTSMNAMFPFSRELQALNAIFEADSEYENAIRIRLDEASMTNLANYATTNIALQLSEVSVLNYATGIWAVVAATNSAKIYTDTKTATEAALRATETLARIGGDLQQSNNVSGKITSEETSRRAGDLANSNDVDRLEALAFMKTGGAVGSDIVVTGAIKSVGGVGNLSSTWLNPGRLFLHQHYYEAMYKLQTITFDNY